MDEMFKYQDMIRESISHENRKLEETDKKIDLASLTTRANEYHSRLTNVKKSMLLIQERTNKLRKKASKLLEEKNKEDLERQRDRERREILEKHLEPVVNMKH